jgi:tRNA(Leu) C34 or U34 (ribose-2'-O)-methylase TrmL
MKGDRLKNGFACIGLYHPLNNWNIGGVLRAAHCYGVELIVIQGGKEIAIKHATDTTGAWRYIPIIRTDDLFSVIPYSCVPIAVEIVDGAETLVNYKHPDRGFYILGPENGSLPERVLKRCRDIVSIPTVSCMNLAATTNVVLYDRIAKGQGRVESVRKI